LNPSFSVVMLVSRNDHKFEEAVESVVKQEPDEFRAYIDTVKIDFVEEPHVREVLKDANAKILVQRPTLAFDRHENLVHNYHRAMLQVKNPWVVKTDDDDVLLGTPRKKLIEEFARDRVGVIHGDKIVKHPYFGYLKNREFVLFMKALFKPTFFSGSKPKDHKDVKFKIFGGTAIINSEAFKQIHPLLDHGYFYDWKTFYWILKAGWKSVYVPEVLFRQNISANIDSIRRSYWGKWPQIMRELDYAGDVPK